MTLEHPHHPRAIDPVDDRRSESGWQEPMRAQVMSLVERRARYLAEVQPGDPGEPLRLLDQQLRHVLHRYHMELNVDPAFSEQCLSESLQLQDRVFAETVGRGRGDVVVRLQALESQAFSLGEALAISRGRSGDQSNAKRLDADFEQLCAREQGLLEEFPGLREALGRVRRDGERWGERRYVESDRDAMALHGTMRWYQTDVAQAHRILGDRDPLVRTSILATFQERYGMDFAEWADRAFFSLRARCFAYLHFGALARVFSERWGVEVGLADAVREERGRSRSMQAGFTEALRSFVTEPHAQRTRALVNDNRVEFARCSLFVEVARGPRGFIALVNLLHSLPPPERMKAMDTISSTQCSYLVAGAEKFEQVVEAMQPPEQARVLLALAHGEDIEAAVRMLPLIGTLRRTSLELLLLFERIVVAHEEEFLERHRAIHGEPLTSHVLASHRVAEPLACWIMALSRRDEYGAAAARARCACLGITAEWPGEVFYRFTSEADKQIVRRYEQDFGSTFWKDALRRLGRRDEIKILRAFVERGSLTPAELIRHCLDGFGADFEGTRECLRGKDERTQGRIAREYSDKFSRYDFSVLRIWRGCVRAAQRLTHGTRPLEQSWKLFWRSLKTPRDLDRDLASEFGGHQLFDLRVLRKGKPMTAIGAYDQLQERIRHERVRGLEGLFQRIDSNGRRWKADRALSDDLAARVRSGLGSEEDKKRLSVLVELVYNGCDAFREAKLRLANVVVNVASIVGAVYATSFLGAAPYISVVSGAILGAFLLRSTARRLIQGLGHSRRDLYLDLVLSFIEGSTLLWGRTVLLFRFGTPYLDAFIRRGMGLLTKTLARHQVVTKWGRMHQAKRSRHVILLGELESQRDRSLRMSASTGRGDGVGVPDMAHSLRALWEEGMSNRGSG